MTSDTGATLALIVGMLTALGFHHEGWNPFLGGLVGCGVMVVICTLLIAADENSRKKKGEEDED